MPRFFFCVIFFMAGWLAQPVDLKADFLTNDSFELRLSSNFVSVLDTPFILDAWGAENSLVVTAENGVTPNDGLSMLRMSDDGLTVTQVVQRVDVSSFAEQIDAGNLRVDSFADFNVSSNVMNARAQIEVLYIPEMLTGSLLDSALGLSRTAAFLDSDPNSWQTLAINDSTVAVGTRSLLVHMFFTNDSLAGNPGYVDSTHLSVSTVPEPSCIGLSTILLTTGFSYRRRRS